MGMDSKVSTLTYAGCYDGPEGAANSSLKMRPSASKTPSEKAGQNFSKDFLCTGISKIKGREVLSIQEAEGTLHSEESYRILGRC